jgi:hypothetical protein
MMRGTNALAPRAPRASPINTSSSLPASMTSCCSEDTRGGSRRFEGPPPDGGDGGGREIGFCPVRSRRAAHRCSACWWSFGPAAGACCVRTQPSNPCAAPPAMARRRRGADDIIKRMQEMWAAAAKDGSTVIVIPTLPTSAQCAARLQGAPVVPAWLALHGVTTSIFALGARAQGATNAAHDALRP